MLTKLVRTQLVLFALITAAALIIMSLFYIRLPEQLGFGRFDVTMELDDAGGLYPKAGVLYRGTEVGQVKKLEVRDGGGVKVTLSIDDDADIPADSAALVRSSSVIGEQYVNFVPGEDADTTRFLAGGDVITTDRTDLPTTTDEVLDAADNLITSVPTDSLELVLDELDTAFRDSGEDLRSLITTSSDFVAEANDNLAETISLIRQVGPVLQTQKEMDPQIRSLVTSLDSVTNALASNTEGLRTIFAESSPFLTSIGDWTDQMQAGFPGVISDIAGVSEVANAYLPAVEHSLIVLPALQTMFVAAMPVTSRDDEIPAINLHLRAGFNTPSCVEGFANANNLRDPQDKTLLPPASDSYCKVAPDSPIAVRGARNAPCPDGVNRGAYAFNCGLVFDEGYVAQQQFIIENGDLPNPKYGASGFIENGNFFLDVTKNLPAVGAKSLEDLLLGLSAVGR